MRNTGLRFCIYGLLISAFFPLISCDTHASSVSRLSVLSANSSGVSARALTQAPSMSKGFIVSGAPEYLEVTLRQIEAFPTETANKSYDPPLWSGTKTLRLDGSSTIDTSDMVLTMPTGHVGRVKLVFDKIAKIKGSITADLRDDPNSFSFLANVTVYTKSAYPYYAASTTAAALGGASSYTNFTSSPSEPVELNLGGDSEVWIESLANIDLAAGDAATLTLLFDLSRMLRFYDGMKGQGANPSDLPDTAYFFCHSVFSNSIVAFFGAPGSIQGYEALYATYHGPSVVADLTTISGTTPDGVTGWMTLVFDTQGNIIKGSLSGDDDNALTVGKGRVEFTAPTAGAYNIDYILDPDTFHLYGFTKSSVIGSATTFRFASPLLANLDGTLSGYRFGDVEYTLRYSQ